MPIVLGNVSLSALAINYAYLVEEGFITFSNVPKSKKSDCAVALIVFGDEDLVTDSKYLEEAKQRIAEANKEEQ